MRGPGVSPVEPGTPAMRTQRERFDQLVLDIVAPLDERWQRHLGIVELAVEDAPMVPDDWDQDTVPLSSLVRGSAGTSSRLIVFRRPLEHRAKTRSDLEALVHTLTLRRKSPVQSYRPSIREFLRDLKDDYGIYIHELPPQLDPYGGPASLREANLNALKDRLRMLGLFQAVSDAEAMQRVQGRYPVKLQAVPEDDDELV